MYVRVPLEEAWGEGILPLFMPNMETNETTCVTNIDRYGVLYRIALVVGLPSEYLSRTSELRST
jgi:hypothetical protein